MKSSVFSRCLNVLIVAADVTEAGRLFHTRAAAIGKDESVERQERWWLLIAVVAVCQDLRQATVHWRGTGMVVPDHEDSDKQVEQACTQSAAPSSTNAVVEEVATHGGVFGKKTPGVPQHSEQTATG